VYKSSVVPFGQLSESKKIVRARGACMIALGYQIFKLYKGVLCNFLEMTLPRQSRWLHQVTGKKRLFVSSLGLFAFVFV
jgi:hypothetical protein